MDVDALLPRGRTTERPDRATHPRDERTTPRGQRREPAGSSCGSTVAVAVTVGAVGVALLCLPGSIASAQAAGTVVTPTEQATRDAERLRVLQDELTREQAAAAESARRRAERLAAADPQGVHDAEQSQARSAENIGALRRELDAATRPSTNARRPAAVSAMAVSRPATGTRARVDGAPWWDVYAQPPPRPATTPDAIPFAAAPAWRPPERTARDR